MSDDIESVLDALREYDRTAESTAMELRLSLAELVIRGLQERGWTQRELARCANLKESFVSRVLHSDSNCTLDTAGRLLFALGVRARFQEIGWSTAAETGHPFSLRLGRTYGKKNQTRCDAAGKEGPQPILAAV